MLMTQPKMIQYEIPMDNSTAWVTAEMGAKLIDMARRRGNELRATQLEEVLTNPTTPTRVK